MLNWVLRYIHLFWENIVALVDKSPITLEEKNRLQQFTVFVLLGVPTMVIYGLYNLIKSNYVLSVLIFISGIGLSIGWFLLRKLRNGRIVYRINTFFFGLLILYLLIVGGQGGSKILWMYTYPLIAFFYLEKMKVFFGAQAYYLFP